MKTDSVVRAPLRPAGWAALIACAMCVLACSETGSEAAPLGDSTSSAAKPLAETTVGDVITASNVLEHERFWPEIVAMVEPWQPADGSTVLKKGYRGALMRVQDDLRVRIAFGRHGDHDVPHEKTDLLERANEIRAGTRHKMGPTFVVHFGAQFLDPSLAKPAPFSTVELLKSKHFLCVFLDPRHPELSRHVESLALARELPDLRVILFPLGMAADQIGVVHETLVAADWLVPFAYPAGADVQARSLLGEVPETPTVLLISAEGRLLLRAPLDSRGLMDRIRVAAGLAAGTAPAESAVLPPIPDPDTADETRG